MKTSYLRVSVAVAAAALSLQALPARAAEGDWILRGGAGVLAPKDNNLELGSDSIIPGGGTLNVDTGTSATFEGTYMFADHWGLELMVAYPFTHDVELEGAADDIAEIDLVPPTLSLQYHLNPEGRWRPYVGAGLNYTTFFNEDTKGALGSASLELDDSWGVAAQLGMDVGLSENWFLNGAVRWIDMDADADINGLASGEVEVDPWLYQLQIGYRWGRPAPVPVAAAPAPVAKAPPPPPPPPPPPADRDGDGVVDTSDQCPDTAQGDRVGAQGCSCDVTRQLQFAFNSADLTDEDKVILDEVAETLTRLKFVSGTVEGHTDGTGPDAFNQTLSERRAKSVAAYLEGKGIATGRLAIEGFGETKPIADNATKEGRAQNRRVVLRRTDCDK